MFYQDRLKLEEAIRIVADIMDAERFGSSPYWKIKDKVLVYADTLIDGYQFVTTVNRRECLRASEFETANEAIVAMHLFIAAHTQEDRYLGDTLHSGDSAYG